MLSEEEYQKVLIFFANSESRCLSPLTVTTNN